MPEKLGAPSPQSYLGEKGGTLNHPWGMLARCVDTSLSIVKFITFLSLSMASGFIIFQVAKQVGDVGAKIKSVLERTATGLSWLAIIHIFFQAGGVAMTSIPIFLPVVSSFVSTWASWGQEDTILQTGPLPIMHGSTPGEGIDTTAIGLALAGFAAIWRHTHGG